MISNVRSELGLMIARAGLLTDAQIHEVSAAARASHVSFVEALTRSALLTEDGLADFVHRKLLIPRVSSGVLARVAPTVARSIPFRLARDRLLLPVSVDHRNNLTLAMADPTDTPAVREVANATGRFVVRAAAPLRPLRTAIERCFGATKPDESSTTMRRPTPVPQPQDEPSPAEALDQLRPRLATATDRDAMLAAVLDFLMLGFGRVAVMVHAREELRLHTTRGNVGLESSARPFRLVVRAPSIFASVLASGRPYFGPLPQRDDTERRFAEQVGGISGNMLLLPIATGSKVPLLLFAHPATQSVDPAAIDGLARATSEALTRLLTGS